MKKEATQIVRNQKDGKRETWEDDGNLWWKLMDWNCFISDKHFWFWKWGASGNRWWYFVEQIQGKAQPLQCPCERGIGKSLIIQSPLVLCKCFPVGLPSQNIFEIIFFDYFCKYHDGRGLGKKIGLFDHLDYRKKTTSIYKRDERCGFYFKNQPKETLRGGVLEDRKKNEHVVYYVLPLGYLRVQDKICEFMSS